MARLGEFLVLEHRALGLPRTIWRTHLVLRRPLVISSDYYDIFRDLYNSQGSGDATTGPMDTEASEADARDARLWRGLDDLLEGVAPSMEDVLEHVAKLKRGQERHDTMPSKI